MIVDVIRSSLMQTRSEIIESLSEHSGVDADVVEAVLNNLSEMAYSSAANGFLLPGFGTIRVVEGDLVRIPGTGETGPGPKKIEFNFDSVAKDRLLSINKSNEQKDEVITTGRTLSEIALNLDTNDLNRANITFDQPPKTKLGGTPDWIQYPHVPTCCGREMTFYGQIDSNFDDSYNIVDAGMLYVFCCDDCATTRSVMQCH